jgi:alpha-tubulin suppressor-like RCC1 family protein
VGGAPSGPGHSLALTSTGAVLAWGDNADGELGDGGTRDNDVPVKVKLPAGTKVTAVAAGAVHSLALTSPGAVFAWGGNNFGQLGDGSYAASDVPVRVKLP